MIRLPYVTDLPGLKRIFYKFQDNTDALERLAKQCRMYAGKPSADKAGALKLHIQIQERLRKLCQNDTSPETPTTTISMTSGSQRAVPPANLSSLEPTEEDVGQSTSATEPSIQPSCSSGLQDQPARATTKTKKRSNPQSGQDPEVDTCTSGSTKAGSSSEGE